MFYVEYLVFFACIFRFVYTIDELKSKQCGVHFKKPITQFLFTFTGSMTILPTVLFLITGVLREAAVKTADNSVPVTVSAALQGIKTIITSPLARVESMQTQWTGLVRSSLASVLEHSEPGKKKMHALVGL